MILNHYSSGTIIHLHGAAVFNQLVVIVDFRDDDLVSKTAAAKTFNGNREVSLDNDAFCSW